MLSLDSNSGTMVITVNTTTRLVVVDGAPAYVVAYGNDLEAALHAATSFYGSDLESGTWAPYETYRYLVELRCFHDVPDYVRVIPVLDSTL